LLLQDRAQTLTDEAVQILEHVMFRHEEGSKGSGLFSRQLNREATAVISRKFCSPVLPTCRLCPEVVSRSGEGALCP
jgi:hypothetical protein